MVDCSVSLDFALVRLASFIGGKHKALFLYFLICLSAAACFHCLLLSSSLLLGNNMMVLVLCCKIMKYIKYDNLIYLLLSLLLFVLGGEIAGLLSKSDSHCLHLALVRTSLQQQLENPTTKHVLSFLCATNLSSYLEASMS